jgi:hypothetical protein
VSYKPEQGSKWANIVAAKEYDNVCITKLLPGELNVTSIHYVLVPMPRA